MPPVEPQNGMPPKVKMPPSDGGQVVARCRRADGTEHAGDRADGRGPPGVARELGIVVEHGPGRPGDRGSAPFEPPIS